MKIHNVKDLPSGESRELLCAGADFVVLKSAPFEVVIQVDDGEKLQIPQGTKIRKLDKFKRGIRVINTSGISVDCIFVTGNGDYSEPQLAGEVLTKNKPLQGIKTSVLPVIAANGEFIAIQANASRHALRAKVTGDNPVRVGGVDVVSNGYLLKPDQELPICSASGSEIYVVAEGLDSEISFFEEFESISYSLDTSSAILTETGAVIYDETGAIINQE